MKKLLIALLAMGVFSVAEAKVYKITEFTKAQKKEAKENAEEGSGDLIPVSTNKGLIWIHVESPVLDTLRFKAKVGECYDVKGEEPFYDKAKKVKCPKK